MCSFQEKITFLLCPYEEMSSHFKLHMETPSYLSLLPNTNFLSSKQSRTPKIERQMSKQLIGIAILRYVLSFTQTNRAL